MLNAKITIGGAGFPPGSPRWKQQLTATLAPHLLGCLHPLGLRPNGTSVGSGTRLGSLQSWLHRHEAGWRPDIARREEAREREQPIAAVEHEYRCAEYEYEYDGVRWEKISCDAIVSVFDRDSFPTISPTSTTLAVRIRIGPLLTQGLRIMIRKNPRNPLGLSRFVKRCLRLAFLFKWAILGSNQRPQRCQRCALTN